MSVTTDTARRESLLPLGFFAAALAALVLAHLLLLWDGASILRYSLLPEDVALAHLIVLGWLTMALMGACYQSLPALAGAPLFSVRLGVVQLVLFAGGVAGLVESFATGRTASLPIHGATAVAAVLLFVVEVGLSLRRAAHWRLPMRYLAAAVALLAVTVGLGFLFALDLRYHWFPIAAHRLAIHAHLGIGGWLGLAVAGVTYDVPPTTEDARDSGRPLPNGNLVLLVVSLAALAAVLAAGGGPGWRTAAAAIVATGFLIYVVDIVWHIRPWQALDPRRLHLVASLGCLTALAVMGVLTASGRPQRWAGETPWTLTYAYVALGGWLTFAVMGYMYAAVPALARQRHAGNGAAVYRPAAIHRHGLGTAAFTLYIAGFVGVAASMLLGAGRALDWAALVATAGVIGYTVTVGRCMIGRCTAERPMRPAERPGRSTADRQ